MSQWGYQEVTIASWFVDLAVRIALKYESRCVWRPRLNQDDTRLPGAIFRACTPQKRYGLGGLGITRVATGLLKVILP